MRRRLQELFHTTGVRLGAAFDTMGHVQSLLAAAVLAWLCFHFTIFRTPHVLTLLIPPAILTAAIYLLLRPTIRHGARKILGELLTESMKLQTFLADKWLKKAEILTDEDRLFKYLAYGTLAVVLIVVLFSVAVSLLIIPFIGSAAEAERWKFLAEMLKFGATAIVGGVGFVGIYYTHKRMMATDRQHALDKRAQFSERFVKGVEMLADADLAIRLGGISALESLASESPQDHRPVMIFLATYVRQNSRLSKSQEIQLRDLKANWLQAIEQDPFAEIPPITVPPLAVDVQAIMTALGRRRDAINVFGVDDLVLDLSGADLRGVNLLSANCGKMIFKHAHIEGACFTDAYLEEADLRWAHLEGAAFEEATLEGADFGNAHLECASLIAARATNANFKGATLCRAVLIEAQLAGADLSLSLSQGANFSGGVLTSAYLVGAHFEGACFRGTYLDEAELSSAHLEGADLAGPKPETKNPIVARQQWAKGLTQEQIDSTWHNCATILPGTVTNRARRRSKSIVWFPDFSGNGEGVLWDLESDKPASQTATSSRPHV